MQEWSRKDSSPLRSVLAFLSGAGVRYAAACHGQTARAFLVGVQKEECLSIATASLCQEGSRLPLRSGTAADSPGSAAKWHVTSMPLTSNELRLLECNIVAALGWALVGNIRGLRRQADAIDEASDSCHAK